MGWPTVDGGTWRVRGARWRRAARVLTAVLALAAGLPAVAAAHAVLKSTAPAAGARLTAPPTAIRLMFTEAPVTEVSTVTLAGPGGAAVSLGTLAYAPDSHRALVAPVLDRLGAGHYTVTWRVMGDDGHPSQGSFSFDVVSGVGGTVAAPEPAGVSGSTKPRRDSVPAPAVGAVRVPASGFDASSPAYVLVRWCLYVGVLVLLGSAAFRVLVLGRLDRSLPGREELVVAAAAAAARLGVGAAMLVLASALARLAAQSYAMHGGGTLLSGQMLEAMLGRTIWGWGWLLQVAGAAVAAAGFARAARGAETPGETVKPAWTLAALGTLVVAFTPALSGHAASAPRLVPFAVLVDGLHVIGAGGWLGSLLVLLAAGLPAATRASERGGVAALVESFSPTALLFAGVVTITGAFAAWLHVGSLAALWQSAYGRTLLVKLAVLSGVVATGAYNYLRVRPTLAHGDASCGASRLRRSATLELGIGIAVLVVTAILVATPTPLDAAAIPR